MATNACKRALLAALICAVSTMAIPALVFAQQVPISQLVSRTVITLPKEAGRFHLVKAKLGDDQKSVTALYTYDGAPKGLEVRLLVAPEGRATEKSFIKLFADTAPQDIAKEPGISKVDAAAQVAMDVPVPQSFLVPSTGPLGTPAHGLRQAFRFQQKGKDGIGVAASIYRNLHGLRLTVLGPKTALDESAWRALPDEAAIDILRHVDIRNFGACGKWSVGPEDPSRRLEMLKEAERALKEGCAETEANQLQPPPDGKTYTIDY